MLKTCSGVSISTVFRAENFSGVSTSTTSPARSCTGVFYRTRISCRKAVRASHAGRLKRPIHGLNRYCRKVSVEYVLTQSFQSERFSGISKDTASCVRAGVAYRLTETLLSERCCGLGQTTCFSAGTQPFFLSVRQQTGPTNDTVRHSYCFVLCFPGETPTKHEASHSPPSIAEIRSANSYTFTLHPPVWRGA